MAKYLDNTGVQYLWKKIKAYVDSKTSGGTTKKWEKVDVGNSGGFKTITVDISKYTEFLLTVGTYPVNENRILASIIIPREALEKMIGMDTDGNFQARYSDHYWAGLDYLGNNKIRYRTSNTDSIAFIRAR